MGELFVMGRQMGILGTSKGDSYARGGDPPPAPAVTAMDPAKTVAVLDAINTINAGDGPPRRMTATGETLPSSKTAVTLPRRMTPERPPAPPAPVIIIPPWLAPPDTSSAGGGGGGGAAPGTGPGPDQVAADPPVLLGLTAKQLAIGGALVVAGYLLLRKKRGGSSGEGTVI